MFILHLALGGCLCAPPVPFGLTADTGGHIAYVLDAAAAQLRVAGVTRVSVVTRLFDDPGLGAAFAEPLAATADGVRIERLATANRAYLEKEALAAELPALTAAFLAHLAAMPRRPDVIHAHFADAADMALAARARFGTPVVYTPHALGLDKRARGGDVAEARLAAERRALAEADAVVVSSANEAEQQVAAYGVTAGTRLHCLPPGVPRRAPAPRGTAARLLGGWFAVPARPLVLAVARPVRKKNLAALLRAFAETPALRAGANLAILAGQQGPHASPEEQAVVAELHRLRAAHGLEDRVALPARHTASQVTALYRRAAANGVFVNPALHEPFGLTLIEAATAGAPVVATREGGAAEIVATIGHGLLVDPRDEAALGAAVARLLAEPALRRRLAEAGRHGAAAYDWRRYARRAVALYGRLQPPPRLLACDIDGTLTGCAAAAAAFAAWRAERRLPFVVATGRDLAAARAVLAAWGLPTPDAFIVDVGTRVTRPDASGGWQECPAFAAALDRDWRRDAVARALRPLGLVPQAPATAGPHKLSFFGSAADAARARAALAARGLAARVIHSHGELIDVLAPHGGKAAAVDAYARAQGLTLAAVVAAGDSGNDADMLDACGHAIVVGNAGAELAGLVPRAGLLRARRHHAAGVLEGLARLGLADALAAGATAPATTAAGA